MAKGYLKKDSLIVVTGFDGIGIDYFTVLSNDSFYKHSPLIEAVDRVVFSRLDEIVKIKKETKPLTNRVLIHLSENQLSLASESQIMERVIIYSMLGKTMKIHLSEKNAVDIDVSDLVNGKYVLEIQFKDQKKLNRSFIKK